MKESTKNQLASGAIITAIGLLVMYATANYVKIPTCENILWVIPNVACYASIDYIVAAGLYIGGIFIGALTALFGLASMIFGIQKTIKIFVSGVILIIIIIYILSPIDIIPDVGVLIGWIDDIMVAATGIYLIYVTIESEGLVAGAKKAGEVRKR